MMIGYLDPQFFYGCSCAYVGERGGGGWGERLRFREGFSN